MTGYTPLFGSLTTGTLYGRWPDIGLWPIVLSLADRQGHVDVTPQYLAGITGLSVDDVLACMRRFCEPDLGSRTKAENGARLVLIDPDRDWGWVVVNHSKYREKARKSSFDAVRTADGRNRERMVQRNKKKTRDNPRSAATTRADPPSDSNSNSNSNKKGERGKRSAASRHPPFDPRSIVNLDPGAFARWVEYRSEIRKPLKEASLTAAARKLATFGIQQHAVVEQAIARSWTGLFALKDDDKAAPVQEGWQ